MRSADYEGFSETRLISLYQPAAIGDIAALPKRVMAACLDLAHFANVALLLQLMDPR